MENAHRPCVGAGTRLEDQMIGVNLSRRGRAELMRRQRAGGVSWLSGQPLKLEPTDRY